jgi:hypothetical protein
MTEMTPLENAVLQGLLSGEDDDLAILRQQAAEAKVYFRKFTGVGFFAEFAVPPDAKRLPQSTKFKLGDVNGTAENVKYALGFVLYVNDGVLSALEGYTYDEPWPDEVHGLVLSYSGGPHRDLMEIKRIVHQSQAETHRP